MRAFRLTTLTCTLILALPLAACGGSATVSKTDAPATPTASATSAATSATDTATGTATATSPSASAGNPAPAQSAGPVDKPASAIESLPQQASHFSAEEQAYLDYLSENGLNVAGVEDQLTATGLNVCADDLITRDAVAGQLVEQRRTDMAPDALGQLIVDAARANLC
ncbi:hypothetical protein HMPREF3104_04585 [Corynebacterium sp. HMSC30G07]|uniref:DUF732 domain-containing protein n=1 Tax=Corynebacterium sp. HMSC30G07 TaxID=1581072 RepID=UPI0008A631EF|nr:DUF732 domain-containing protein [Corynebacterium sp. HMSC30G07]OFT76731.1 hypothetical protein HMPREF3104_04585 [Corynebacterium sp. HMSC30G07]